MSFSRTLAGYTPPERNDAVFWRTAQIEEAATPDVTPTDIGTPITLLPAISDPMTPFTYTLRTTAATLEFGWYRVRWIADTGETSTTAWVERRELSPYAPTVGDIATLLRARLVEIGGVRVESFTDQTDPSAEMVQQMINLHTPLLFAQLGSLDGLGCSTASELKAAARTLAAQRVALEVELSRWPEEIAESGSAGADVRRASIDADVTRLADLMEACRSAGAGDGGDSTSRSDPAWLFPTMTVLRW
jgi:hypothetical protein